MDLSRPYRGTRKYILPPFRTSPPFLVDVSDWFGLIGSIRNQPDEAGLPWLFFSCRLVSGDVGGWLLLFSDWYTEASSGSFLGTSESFSEISHGVPVLCILCWGVAGLAGLKMRYEVMVGLQRSKRKFNNWGMYNYRGRHHDSRI